MTAAIIAFTTFASNRWGGQVSAWRRQLVEGVDPDSVPIDIRRRVLNVPLVAAVFSMVGWMLAGLFYLPYFLWISKTTLDEGLRGFIGIVLVGGPISSALAFLSSEFYWRRQIPLFYPEGHLERTKVLRIPILTRLGATFLLTSVLPLILMLIVDLRFGGPAGAEVPDAFREQWGKLMRAQAFIVVATSVASVAMALLVTRFINRPVQALRAAMARIAAGDLTARVPVRSVDELGELNEHFNAMVDDLRLAERTRELFGRYVSPAVAGHALERGIALGGEVVYATAMFADLRGFTALTRRSSAAGVVEVLNEYYAIVERVCEREGGIITQFLGDGVVVVFGAPLKPDAAHAASAVRAAVGLQRALAARGPVDGVARLAAGIGLCTGRDDRRQRRRGRPGHVHDRRRRREPSRPLAGEDARPRRAHPDHGEHARCARRHHRVPRPPGRRRAATGYRRPGRGVRGRGLSRPRCRRQPVR